MSCGFCININTNNIDIDKLKRSLIRICNLGSTSLLVNVKLDVKDDGTVTKFINDEVFEKIKDVFYDTLPLDHKIILRFSHIRTFSDEDLNRKLIQTSIELYKKYLSSMKSFNIDTISLANESALLFNNENLIDDWSNAISHIRDLYSNIKVTFDLSINQAYKFCLYDLIDIIHLHYYPFICTDENNIDLIQCYKNAKKNLDEAYMIVNKYDKEVLITEFGCQPFTNRLQAPNISDIPTRINENVQDIFFKVTLPILDNAKWVKDFYIWESTYISESYSPLGRKAENIIRGYFHNNCETNKIYITLCKEEYLKYFNKMLYSLSTIENSNNMMYVSANDNRKIHLFRISVAVINNVKSGGKLQFELGNQYGNEYINVTLIFDKIGVINVEVKDNNNMNRYNLEFKTTEHMCKNTGVLDIDVYYNSNFSKDTYLYCNIIKSITDKTDIKIIPLKTIQ